MAANLPFLCAGLLSCLAVAATAQAEPQPQRILIDGIAPAPSTLAPDAAQRHLLETPRLDLVLLNPGRATTLPAATEGRSATYIVVQGDVTVRSDGPPRTLPVGSLIHLASAWPHGAQFSARAGAALLAISAPAAPWRAPDAGDALGKDAWTVRADQPPAFSPPGHAKTVNRVLFENAAMRIERGTIGVGGGADRHSHARMEQIGFVLEPGPPALLYMAPGTPHGGEIRKTPLDLIIIYTPPSD